MTPEVKAAVESLKHPREWEGVSRFDNEAIVCSALEEVDAEYGKLVVTALHISIVCDGYMKDLANTAADLLAEQQVSASLYQQVGELTSTIERMKQAGDAMAKAVERNAGWNKSIELDEWREVSR